MTLESMYYVVFYRKGIFLPKSDALEGGKTLERVGKIVQQAERTSHLLEKIV